jgi:sec-independent protein translocase protein TatA
VAFGLGAPELIIVLVIFLIVFGVGRLPEVGSAMGRSVREFRHSMHENPDESADPSGETT